MKNQWAFFLDHVVSDPVKIFSDPSVDPWELWVCTVSTPGHHPTKLPSSSLQVETVEWPTRVTLACIPAKQAPDLFNTF